MQPPPESATPTLPGVGAGQNWLTVSGVVAGVMPAAKVPATMSLLLATHAARIPCFGRSAPASCAARTPDFDICGGLARVMDRTLGAFYGQPAVGDPPGEAPVRQPRAAPR